MPVMNSWLRSWINTLAVAVALGGVVPAARAAPTDLLVASNGTDNVLRYDGVTGAFLGEFVSAGSGGLDAPRGIRVGPDGNLYVASDSGEVKRFDGTTGAFIDTFASGIRNGFDWGPDGNLYGAAFGNLVLGFDGTTGQFIDYFAGLNGLSGATGLKFGPDGNLYVGSYNNSRVLRFDGTNGAFIDTFASLTSGGVGSIAFGPDGNLYVGLFDANDIVRFDGATGAPLGSFIAAADPHPQMPFTLVFGPDGNLYVGGETDEVLRYDGASGAFIDSFASGGGLDLPRGLAFLTAEAQCTLDLGETRSELFQSQLLVGQLQSALAACQARRVFADSDSDGEEDSTDACPSTSPGAAVDPAGCSLDQFCAAIPVGTKEGARMCRAGDYRNDEPSIKKPQDCQVQETPAPVCTRGGL